MPKINDTLAKAKTDKNDEFYTQFEDIQSEVNAYLEYNPDVFRNKTILLPCDDPEWSNFTKFFAQNFERFGLKKLISTSYANCKKNAVFVQLSLFESTSPQFDEKKTDSHGKIFILDRDNNKSGKIDINDLEWDYLEGDGDFRSDEVKRLRDEADIIITNPPFSLFREFVNWIFEGEKDFLIIGNINAITYKEIFPRIKDNKMWIGKRFNKRVNGKNMTFLVPDSYEMRGTEMYTDDKGKKYISVAGTGWFTNLELGKRHQVLDLMTMEDNIKYSKYKELQNKRYMKYETFDAIDVPHSDAIPKNYKGIMGVPKSFLDNYNPEQFKILGYEREDDNIKVGIKNMPEEFLNVYRKQGGTGHYTKGMKMLCYYDYEGNAKIPFSRILIQYTDEWMNKHSEDFLNQEVDYGNK